MEKREDQKKRWLWTRLRFENGYMRAAGVFVEDMEDKDRRRTRMADSKKLGGK